MNRYSYQVLDSENETLSGEIDAENASEAIAELERRGLSIQSIQLVPAEKVRSDVQLAEFHNRLAKLLEQHSLWLPALDAISGELPKSRVQKKLQALLKPLRENRDVGQFLANRDAIALLPLIARSGADESTRDNAIRDWLLATAERYAAGSLRRKSLAYPVILFIVSLVIFVVVNVFLLPTFQNLYSDMQIKLPSLTQFACWCADQINLHFARTAMYLAVALGLGYGIVRIWRHFAMTHRIFGRLVSGRSDDLFAMSTLISTLAELFNLNAPSALSLEIAGRSSRHAYYEEATSQMAKAMTPQLKATSLPIAIKRLPPLLLHALHAGSDGRPNVPLLRELAILYRDRARTREDWYSAGIPIVGLLAIGTFIGYIVIIVFLPMISLINVLST